MSNIAQRVDLRRKYQNRDPKMLKIEAAGLIERAEKEKRDLNDDEKLEFDVMMEEAQMEETKGVGPQLWNQTSSTSSPSIGDTRIDPKLASEWIGANGRPVTVLNNSQRLSALPSNRINGVSAEDLSLGRWIRGIATGDFKRYCPAELAALGENINHTGGYLAPGHLSSKVIDLARAKTSVLVAGGITVNMEHETLRMARVKTDPTMQLKTENLAFTGSDPSFDAVNFTAHTIGTFVSISRELAADAPNIDLEVERILSASLAAELDRQALRGTGSTELSGLDVDGKVGETTSVGGITWQDLGVALVDIQSNNFEPNAYIISPKRANNLAEIQSSGGGEWLGPQDSVAQMQRIVTTNCADTDIYVGQWDQYALGIRTDAMIEVTTEGGGSFEKYQVLVRIVFRGDVKRINAGAFHVLRGITD